MRAYIVTSGDCPLIFIVMSYIMGYVLFTKCTRVRVSELYKCCFGGAYTVYLDLTNIMFHTKLENNE